LEELERRLRAFGAPIVDAGVPADDIRAAFDAEGLDAPDDVVAWWEWHDGAVLSDAAPILSGPGVELRSENTLIEDWHVLSLGEATRSHRWFRKDYDLLPAGWFPILVTGAKPTMWIDCTPGADAPAPLYVDEHLPKPEGPLFPSLANFVAAIIRAFDERLIVPHPEDPRVPTFDARPYRLNYGAWPFGSQAVTTLTQAARPTVWNGFATYRERLRRTSTV
jgi:hypothetical protein